MFWLVPKGRGQGIGAFDRAANASYDVRQTRVFQPHRGTALQGSAINAFAVIGIQVLRLGVQDDAVSVGKVPFTHVKRGKNKGIWGVFFLKREIF